MYDMYFEMVAFVHTRAFMEDSSSYVNVCTEELRVIFLCVHHG